MDRAEALALVEEHTSSSGLRQHMLAVEAAMRAYARRYGEDAEAWGVVGLVHDFDYERYPNPGQLAEEEHPAWGVRVLRARGLPEPSCQAILGHASYTGVPRVTRMARVLFAVDELSGFLVACALVRPSRSFADLEVASVKKKLKDRAFARAVSREDIALGAAELEVPLEEHVARVIAALREAEPTLGLGGPRPSGA